ncbi:MAG: hypothetical protein ACK44A_10575, partial [Roseateles sp.]
MSSRWRWLGLAAVLVALGGGGLGWRFALQPAPQSRAAEALSVVVPAASVTGASRAAARPLSVASATVPGVGDAEARDRAALMQRMRADWCGFGVAEASRQSEAVFAKAGDQPIGLEALAEVRRTPGAQVLDEATAQVRQRWVAALLRRGDPRSVAVAESLGGPDGDEAQSRARLQALARTSADPMVTALALQHPCELGRCSNVDRAQWSRLEPANLQAWLALLGDAAARRTQEAYALDRMASEARYSRSYRREYQELLLSLPQTDMPGLAQEAELQLLISSAAVWPMGSLRPLTDACAARPVAPVVQQRCVAVAELLWPADDLMARSLAMGLARRLVAARPELRPRGEPRARELEA